jgi:misacylated tRNA(Ala) deacylase
LQAARYRRLGEEKLRGSAADRPGVGDGYEGPDVIEFHLVILTMINIHLQHINSPFQLNLVLPGGFDSGWTPGASHQLQLRSALMTELLYQDDCYLREFTARVTGAHPEENAVVLDQSVFYPGGGGQPSDTGTLRVGEDTFNVTGVRKQGDEALHKVDGQPPPIHTEVTGTIDWERRYQLMRTHCALHVLCGVIWRDYGVHVTSARMEPLKGHLDFEFETLKGDLIREIERKINEEVDKGLDVRAYIKSREEALKIPDLIRTKINLLPKNLENIRIVEIVGLDVQADGGTHVANTNEIGKITIVNYKSKGRINKRILIGLQP